MEGLRTGSDLLCNVHGAWASCCKSDKLPSEQHSSQTQSAFKEHVQDLSVYEPALPPFFLVLLKLNRKNIVLFRLCYNLVITADMMLNISFGLGRLQGHT